MPNIGADMLTQAAETIKQRQSQYGPPEKNFKVIAARWNAHLEGRGYKLVGPDGFPVLLDMSDVAHMSADIKMARLSENMDHEDSWKDLAGYAACGRQVTASVLDEIKAKLNSDSVAAIRREAESYRQNASALNWYSVGGYRAVPDDLKTGDQIEVKHGSGDKVVTVGSPCRVCSLTAYNDTDGTHWDSTEIIAYRRT